MRWGCTTLSPPTGSLEPTPPTSRGSQVKAAFVRVLVGWDLVLNSTEEHLVLYKLFL